jgi:PST family polysaccharide transporter
MTRDDRPDGETPQQTPVDLDRLILRSVGWLGFALGSRQAVSFFTTLLLARLLTPSEFGLVALAATFLVFLEPLQDSGLSAALVYRRDRVERAAGAVLVYAPIIGLGAFVLGFAAAPYFARAFHEPDVTAVIRALLGLVIIRSLGVAPWAILERTMNYRARTVSDLAAALVQAVVAVSLAFAGAGVWSIVAGQLSAGAVSVTLVWFLVPWRPSPRHADWGTLRDMLRYGRWVGAGNMFNLVNRTLDNLVVGRLLGTTSLGFYTVAFRFADIPPSLLGPILGRVMFPVYSMLQHDVQSVRRVYLQNLQRVALALLPIVVGLMIATKPIVLALLGDQWLPVVTPLRILAVWALVRSFVATAGEVYNGRGKPQLSLYFLIPGTGVLLLLLLLLVPRYDLDGAALAQTLAITLVGVPGLYVAMRLVRLPARELAKGLAPAVLCTALLAVALVVLLPLTDSLSPVVAVVVLVSSGAAVYLGSTAVFAKSIVMPLWVSVRGTRGQPT